MKSILYLLATALSTAEISPSFSDPPPPICKAHERNYMRYCSFGGSGLLLPYAPEVSIGCRKLHSHNVWDINGGANVGGYFFTQASYLYYKEPSKGFFAGAGLTGGYLIKDSILECYPWFNAGYNFNVQTTFGYQWEKSFLQFQVTPRLTTTFSYGIGF